MKDIQEDYQNKEELWITFRALAKRSFKNRKLLRYYDIIDYIMINKKGLVFQPIAICMIISSLVSENMS